MVSSCVRTLVIYLEEEKEKKMRGVSSRLLLKNLSKHILLHELVKSG